MLKYCELQQEWSVAEAGGAECKLAFKTEEKRGKDRCKIESAVRAKEVSRGCCGTEKTFVRF